MIARRSGGPLRVAACLVVLSAAVALAAPAGAETPLEHAKALAGRATVEYNVGHFDQALDLYSKAYEVLPTAALLFDIGQCQRMLGHVEPAIFFYQGYLREKPEAPNRAVVEGLLRDLQRQLDAQRAAAARADEQQRKAADDEAQRRGATQAPSPAPFSPATSAPTTTSHPALRIAGIATAGAGVVLVGTAVALGLHASSLSSELTQLSSTRGTWSPKYQADYDSGKTSATTATILYVAGGLALATGGVLTYLGWPRAQSDARPAAALAPVPGGAAVLVAGSF